MVRRWVDLRDRRCVRVALTIVVGATVLVTASVAVLALAGGLRLSDPRPAMEAEGRRFAPPQGSTLLSVTRSEIDRVCFLQCTTRSVTLEFEAAESRTPNVCQDIRAAIEQWAGEARDNSWVGSPGEPVYECDVRVSIGGGTGWCAAALLRAPSSAADAQPDLSVTVSEGC